MSIENFFTSQFYKKANIVWLFLPISILHYFFYAIRKFLYKKNILKSKRLPIQTLVVGNIVLGGSGKTQLVLYLAKYLIKKNIKIGIISRGYKGKYNQVEEVKKNSNPVLVGDEALMLKQKINAPVFVGKSRYEAGSSLLKKYKNINLIISDDGLQHLKLNYDIKILINDDRFVTNNFMFPVGPFREPLSSINDFNGYILNNSPGLKKNYLNFFIKDITNLYSNKTIKINEIDDVHLSIGIGNPEKLIQSLSKLCKFKYKIYPDHYEFIENDFDGKYNYFITEKDAVKCKKFKKRNIWVINAEVKVCPDFIQNIFSRVNNG